MEPLMMKPPKMTEPIDLVEDEDEINEVDTVKMLEMVTAMVAATDAVSSSEDEPLPEPTQATATMTAELLDLMEKLDHVDDEDNAQRAEEVQALADTCRRVADEAFASANDNVLASDQPAVPAETVVDEVAVALEADDGPSWLEKTLGPWVAHHRTGLRAWLLVLLTLYVMLFASMVFQSGLRGLGERTPTAAARDLLWAVLMGLIVLLAVGKHY